MIEQRLWVTGPLPAGNQLLDAKQRTSQAPIGGKGRRSPRWNAYAQLKSEWCERIGSAAERCGLQPSGPSYFTFYILEPNRKRDPDNISFGATKMIFDGLFAKRLIPGDGWAHILGYVTYWDVSDLPGVALFIRPDRVLTKEECLGGMRAADLEGIDG